MWTFVVGIVGGVFAGGPAAGCCDGGAFCHTFYAVAGVVVS